jgi:hypothetical protein
MGLTCCVVQNSVFRAAGAALGSWRPPAVPAPAVSCRPLQAFPLPVEGTETMVMAENESVTSYMINLGEALEKVGERE